MMKSVLKHTAIALPGCVLAVCMLIFAAFIFYVLNGAFGGRAHFLDMYAASAIAAFLYTLVVWVVKKPACRKLKLGRTLYFVSAVLIPTVIFALVFAAVHFSNTRISISDDMFEVYLLVLFVCYELVFSTAAVSLIEIFLFVKNKIKNKKAVG